MVPEWQKAVVVKIAQATPNTRRYWLQLPETHSFQFKAGQFVTLDLPIHEQKNRRWRSYSIASMPDGSNIIELVIVLVENGIGTKYFFDEVHIGTELTLRGPHGLFVLPDEINRDIIMICTGTGIAPFRSMLHYINRYQIPHRNLYLIFGTRKRQDLLYEEEMRQLERELQGFHFHPTLSREDWPGLKGYVHPVYERICKDCPPVDFLLCGWRVMIDEAKRRIQELGYDKKSIHQELYG